MMTVMPSILPMPIARGKANNEGVAYFCALTSTDVGSVKAAMAGHVNSLCAFSISLPGDLIWTEHPGGIPASKLVLAVRELSVRLLRRGFSHGSVAKFVEMLVFAHVSDAVATCLKAFGFER